MAALQARPEVGKGGLQAGRHLPDAIEEVVADGEGFLAFALRVQELGEVKHNLGVVGESATAWRASFKAGSRRDNPNWITASVSRIEGSPG